MQWLPPAAAVRERYGLGNSRDRSLTRPPGPTARLVQSIPSAAVLVEGFEPTRAFARRRDRSVRYRFRHASTGPIANPGNPEGQDARPYAHRREATLATT